MSDHRCENCGKTYKVSVVVSDETWNRIKTSDGGPLCGTCVVKRLESRLQSGKSVKGKINVWV